ncbi:MAG TPA: hypothetical protein VIM53_02055 [Candidatus Saccharimonadales bacterium]
MYTQIETIPADAMSDYVKETICEIAAEGFGRDNDQAMRADTMRHIHDAAAVQVARQDKELVGFSMYGSSLWRPCR